MAISVFLSTVSDEFLAYRDQLVHDLTRHNVAVKVQEEFKDLGGDTLDKLDVYITHCDAVVHLVGDMCGAAADERQQQALLAKHVDLQSKLPPLYEALTTGGLIPYTQWEAWLALYHGKALLIAKGKIAAPRGPNFAPNDASRASQAEHLARLKALHRYRGSEFGSPDELAKQIAYTTILDLLVANQVPREVRESDAPPLETMHGGAGSELAHFGYRARAADLVGRNEEMAWFQAFLDQAETFLWCAIEGPGGSGKSRFVLEALLTAMGWHAGFLPSAAFDWTHWNPAQPTVIAIDDARSRQAEVADLVTRFAARRADNALFQKVRIVLIDRDLAIGELVTGQEVTRHAFDMTRYNSALKLKPLCADDVLLIVKQMAPDANEDAVKRADEWLRDQEAQGNPLIAMLAAKFATVAHGSTKIELKDVVADRLASWGILPRLGPAVARALEEDDRLALAFATICALPLTGLRSDELSKHVLRPGGQPLQPSAEMRDRLAHALGQPIKNAIPVLAPDLFGEIFVLELLRGRRELGLDDGEFMAAAWQRDNYKAADFCRRCWADFPDHPESTRLLGQPLTGSRQKIASWMHVAEIRYKQCLAQGCSKEAQRVLARIVDAYLQARSSRAFSVVVDLRTDVIDCDREYDRSEAVSNLVSLLDLPLPSDLANIPATHAGLRTTDEIRAELRTDSPKPNDQRWINNLDYKASWLIDACFEAADESALEQLQDSFERGYVSVTDINEADWERSPVLRSACDAFRRLAIAIPQKRRSMALDACGGLVMLLLRSDLETTMPAEAENKLTAYLDVLVTRLWSCFGYTHLSSLFDHNSNRTVLEMLPVARLARQRLRDEFGYEVDVRILEIILSLYDHDLKAEAKILEDAWLAAPTRIGGDGEDRARRVQLIQELRRAGDEAKL